MATSEREESPTFRVVFCPTRDRAKQLARTIEALVRDIEGSGFPDTLVVVVDDSTNSESRAQNRETVGLAGLVKYHGQNEQRRFLAGLAREGVAEEADVAPFIRLLGGAEWDLGGVRNHMALLAVAASSDRSWVAMIDDDVELGGESGAKSGVKHESSIGCLWEGLREEGEIIVGGSLSGMPDLSTIERAEIEFRKEANLGTVDFYDPPFPISGGLLACRRKWLMRTPFPRTYNEDWIWLSGSCWRGAKYVRSSAHGTHAWSPPKPDRLSDLKQEMMGEVLCSGLVLAYARSADDAELHRSMLEPTFWQEVIRDECDYLIDRRSLLYEQLRQSGQAVETPRVLDLLENAIRILSKMSPRGAACLSSGYLGSREPWERLLQRVDACRASGWQDLLLANEWP